MWANYRVYGWWLCPNFAELSAVGKSFYSRLAFEKLSAFETFTKKYLRHTTTLRQRLT